MCSVGYSYCYLAKIYQLFDTFTGIYLYFHILIDNSDVILQISNPFYYSWQILGSLRLVLLIAQMIYQVHRSTAQHFLVMKIKTIWPKNH